MSIKRERDFFLRLEQCIRCGTCKAPCPTYETGKHEALSGRGRLVILHALLSGALPVTDSATDKVLSCIQCGACTASCPIGIEIPELIYTGRKLLGKRKGGVLGSLSGLFLKHPEVFLRLTKPLKGPIEKLLIKRGLVPHDFTFPQGKNDQAVSVMSEGKKKGTVLLFAGCTVNYVYPHLHEAMVRVLTRLGYEIILPEKELCCGSPFRTLGMEKEAVLFAEKNINILKKYDALATISPCPTCTLALKKEYVLLSGEGIGNAMDISQFLLTYEQERFQSFTPEHETGGYYHDPCHMKYGLGLSREPRTILRSCGIMPANGKGDICCGFGGTFSARYPDMSRHMADYLIKDIETEEVTDVFTSCPGCILQLRKATKKNNIYHVIEAVEKALDR